jgi:molecular chaperone HtpG
VNAKHPVIQAALARSQASASVGAGPESSELGDWIELLYDQALITEGSSVDDPNQFARRVTALMTKAAGAAARG